MGDLSRHFSRHEFTEDRRPSIKPVPAELLWRLEALRTRIGRPLPIVSWRRTPAYNRAVGGVRHSRHLRGDAVDIPPGLVRVDEAVAVGFRGIGHRGGWVTHLDCRPGDRVVIWKYP